MNNQRKFFIDFYLKKFDSLISLQFENKSKYNNNICSLDIHKFAFSFKPYYPQRFSCINFYI